ncbi:protein VASP homolog [Lolium rigidum]|uniref:protein VASP homolog n=1 Tax=Lolium rigidum TaxID=89674 RepID=UPI001F5DBA21|nr:protein VASP homolog [Lolium rigidum]
MPSTLKRPSLGRLLASLRPPPSRAGSPSNFPVQTGFPTSLADLVVKNHGRLRKPRKPRRPTAALVPPPVALTVAAEELPLSPPPQPLSPVAVQRPDAAPRPPEGGTVFRLRPELLVLGGTVALALLALWSEGTVAAFTVAALSLLWIESSSRRRRRLPTAEADAMLDSCGRGAASPIREVEESPSSSCSDSDKGERSALVAGGGDDLTTPKRKGKRSLRKLISKKLQKKPKSKDSSSSYKGEAEQPDAAAGDDIEPATPEAPITSNERTPSESSIEWSSSSSEAAAVVADGRGAGRFPLAAFVPVILTGLAVGKLPATALSVLCIVFSSAVQRLK